MARTPDADAPRPEEDRNGGSDGTEATLEEEATYVSGFKLAVILTALCLCNFLVALDTTIIATAIPVISQDFHSLTDVGWYVSAYFLTNCAFQLLYGKLYTLYDVKPMFIIAMSIFEIGSLICAVSPTSTVFIFGRAVAGVGAAGTFSGALIAIVHAVRPDERAQYSGIIVGMFGIAAIAGPLIGGAFTSQVTWRWCFYINLPVGGAAILGILFFFRAPKQKKTRDDSTTGVWASIAKFDPFGTVCFLGSIICVLLALQLGGTTYSFSDGRIIALFVLFGVLLIAFIAIQIWGGPNATIPPRIMKTRSIPFAALFMFCVGGHFFVLVYFLPIWFQGVRGVSAFQSGIDTLPILLAQTICVVLGGIIVSTTGHYIPLIWLSVILASVGAGLLTTLQVDSSTGKWIGFQILYGFGGGLGYQQGITAAQTVLSPEDIAIGTAFMVFVQNLGGTIFISAANNVFDAKLVENLAAALPTLSPTAILNAGATGLKQVVPAAQYTSALVAYNDSVVKTFQMALILACLTSLGAVGVEWKRAPVQEKKKKDDGKESAAENGAAPDEPEAEEEKTQTDHNSTT